jgi:hypothetical protein
MHTAVFVSFIDGFFVAIFLVAEAINLNKAEKYPFHFSFSFYRSFLKYRYCHKRDEGDK